MAVRSNELEQDRHFAHLGLEPLGNGLSGAELKMRARFRRAPVKNFLMDGTVVVGLGNIYTSEALHRAGIHPRRSVARISAARWQRLVDAVQETLEDAIHQGGTTLNDFTDGEGQEGLFQVSLAAYGRAPSAEPVEGGDRLADHSVGGQDAVAQIPRAQARPHRRAVVARLRRSALECRFLCP